MRPATSAIFFLHKRKATFFNLMVKLKPSSSKQAQVSRLGVVSMEHDKEPRLSGAYIRSLVKHLTTSVKSKDSFNEEYPKLPDSISSNEDNYMLQESPPPPPPPPPQPYKKQVRRRQHTTKPYQERLLNMAEARREIVTALRYHRASKQRQASGEHCLPEASTAAVSATTAVVPYYWPIPDNNPPPLPTPTRSINFTLPNQTLGLNLNLQDFKTLDTNLYHNPPTNYYSTSSSSSSSPSTSSSAAIPLAIEEVAGTKKVVTLTPTTSSVTSSSRGVHHVMDDERITEEVVTTTTSSVTSSSEGLHCALDDEGMEEIKSLGEQHQMEWNDTVNMLMYARWFTFLKTVETEQEGENDVNRINEFHPCMDIGETEGMKQD